MRTPEIWDAVAAVGTVSAAVAAMTAAVVALFREDIRRWIAAPDLFLDLLQDDGVETFVTFGRGGRHGIRRYYHVRVWNPAREFPYHGVAVFLRAVYFQREDGVWVRSWEGRARLQWRNEELRDARYEAKTVGGDWDADLLFIEQGHGSIFLNTVDRPNNLRLDRDPGVRQRYVIQARGEQGDSWPTRMDVVWSGDYADRPHVALAEWRQALGLPRTIAEG